MARRVVQRESRQPSRGSGFGKRRVRYWRCRTFGYSFIIFLPSLSLEKNRKSGPRKSGSYPSKGVRFLLSEIDGRIQPGEEAYKVGSVRGHLSMLRSID